MFNIIIILFLFFGLFGIIFPQGLINNINNSYTVADLIQGWGIYSITIGLILQYPNKIKNILLAYFIISILWHLHIIKKSGYTSHHRDSIVINIIAIIFTYIQHPRIL